MKSLAILGLFLFNFAHSFEADEAKILFRNLGKRAAGYYALQGGAIKESRKDIQGFLVYFKNKQAITYYPIKMEYTSWGATLHGTMIEIDNQVLIKNFNGKTPRQVLGLYKGGKVGLSLMAGFKSSFASNKSKVRFVDSSLKLSTLGIDLSYVKYSIAIDHSHKKEIPTGWDEVVRSK